VIDYVGNIPTGITVKVESTVAVEEYEGPLRIITEASRPEIFEAEVEIDALNYFEMSSLQGRKYVRSIRTDTEAITNRIPALNLDSDWPRLYPGNNNFAVVPESGFEGQEFTLTYSARFGGL